MPFFVVIFFPLLCSSCDSLGRLARAVSQWRAVQTDSSQIKLRPRRLRTGPPTSTRYESLPTEEGMVATGNTLGKQLWFAFAQYRLCLVTHHPSIWCRVTFSTNVTKSSHYTRCNMKLKSAQHCRWNLFSKEKTLMTASLLMYLVFNVHSQVPIKVFPSWLSFHSGLELTGVVIVNFSWHSVQARR